MENTKKVLTGIKTGDRIAAVIRWISILRKGSMHYMLNKVSVTASMTMMNMMGMCMCTSDNSIGI